MSPPVHPMEAVALALTAKGFRVFPVVPGRKKPPLIKEPHLQATDDAETIAGWWGRWPGANTGVATGSRTRLVVLDFDCKGETAEKRLELFELMYDTLPPTWSARSPGGSIHRYYRVPEGVTIRSSVVTIAPAVDVRGENHYVVGPGSVTAAGSYTWDPGFSPDETQLADAPEWLIDATIAAGGRRASADTASLYGQAGGAMAPVCDLDMPYSIECAREWLRVLAPMAVEREGGREVTKRVIQRLGDLGLSAPKIVEVLTEEGGWDECKAFPPWVASGEGDKLEQLVHDLWENHRDRPIGCDWRTPAHEDFGGVSAAVADVGGTAPPERGRWEVINVAERRWSPHQDYAVRGLLTRGMTGLVAGVSNAGKTPMVFDLAAHIAKGTAWNGKKVRQGYVLIASTEGFAGLLNRIEALRREHFADGPAHGVDFLPGSFDLRSTPRDADELAKLMLARAAAFGLHPTLLVIDTTSHTLAGGDESNPEHVRAWISNVKRIARKTGAAVLGVHHPPKDGSSAYRGSSLWANDLDLIIAVEMDKATRTSRVTTPRAKDWPEIEPLHFRIKKVTLGVDQEGDNITAPVVEWAPSPQSRADADGLSLLSPTDREVLRVVIDLDGRFGEAAIPDPRGVGPWLKTAEIARAWLVRSGRKPEQANSAKAAVRRSTQTIREHGLVEKGTPKQGVRIANNANNFRTIGDFVRSQ